MAGCSISLGFPLVSVMGFQIFQREMDRMVDQNGLQATFPYLDNVTICGRDQQDHDANLKNFFSILPTSLASLTTPRNVFSA